MKTLILAALLITGSYAKAQDTTFTKADATLYGSKAEKMRNKMHFVINHNQKEYVNGHIHTNTIEGFWSLLKRGNLGIYHSMSAKHLQKYLDEFVFRYNTIDLQKRAVSIKCSIISFSLFLNVQRT
jgi:hypothetical protein